MTREPMDPEVKHFTKLFSFSCQIRELIKKHVYPCSYSILWISFKMKFHMDIKVLLNFYTVHITFL